jgi:hypothetical protein
MEHSLNQPLPAANPIYPSNYCNAKIAAHITKGNGTNVIIKENRPSRITDRTCFALVSDIMPDCFDMGFHPSFSFALWRRPGVLTRTLASQVRRSPAYFPVDSLPCRKPPVTVSIRRDPRKGLALHSGAKKSGLHRIDHDPFSMRSHLASRIWAP